MKITFIAHASLLVETQGLSILSDPWWKGPCFGTQWWVYPRPYLAALETRPPDYIYISHGHHDHFHPGTLRTLPRTAKVVVAKGFDIAPPIRKMGFEVLEVGDRQEFELGRGVKIRIMPTCGVDSLMVVSDDEQTCVNLNDSLHSVPVAVQDRFVRILLDYYPKGIDYVFCGYGVASHFPNCYILPGKDREATAAARQAHFNRNWVRIIQKLAPMYGFPFAAEVVLLDQMLFWANEPIHNSQRPTDVFRQSNPGSKTEVIDCAPGFMIENRLVRARETKQPLSTALLSREYAQEIEKANRVAAVSASEIKELTELLRQNVALCKPYLVSRKPDYSFLVQIRNAQQGIGIYKKKSRFEVVVVEDPSPEDFDLTYITRFPYLKNSLVTKHGYEVLFVGSGGVYQYRSAAQAWQNLQRDFAAILTRYEASPNTYNRRAGRLMPLRKLKQSVKALLGLKELDLYDLRAWTVVANSAKSRS